MVFGTFSSTLLTREAQAACPGTFSGRDCNGTSGGAVCSGSGASVTCDLGVSGDSSANAKFVSPTHTEFRAYGYEGDGEPFCCEITVDDGCSGQLSALTIYGTSSADVIDLNDTNPDPVLHLECFHAKVYGLEQDDTITGSNSTYNEDELHGDDDDDTIYGAIGADLIFGEAGVDDLHGGPDDDYIWGGSETDYLYGDIGADYLYGEGGDDFVKGGDGADHIYGDDNDDEICGQWGDDVLDGGPDDDGVWGGPDSDTNSGGLGSSDYCEYPGDDITCENTIETTVCPW